MTTPRSESQSGERRSDERQYDETAQPPEPTAIPEDQVAPQQSPDEFSGPPTGVDPPAAPNRAEVRQGTSADTGLDESLFTEQSLTELRARWIDVQATFVDDPRECVQKADSLVSAAVEQLTTSFSGARARLEDQWSRGEEASTEDLRIALQRYRDFFERLLAV